MSTLTTVQDISSTPINVEEMSKMILANWPKEIPSVYMLCHPEKEVKRFRRLIPHMIMRGIPKEYLRFVAPTWSDTLEDSIIFKVYDPYLNRGVIPPFSFKSSCLTKGEISLILNFYSVVQHASTNNKDDQATLVLESDSYLRRDFVPRIIKIMQDLSGQDWDYVSLGEGVGTRPPGCETSYYGEQKLYKPPHSWVFRCTDSMLFSQKFIKKLAKSLLPFRECLDWELNFQLAFHQGKALWADPPISEQGTCFKRYGTSLK
jgi:hypothetical protein